MDDVVKMNTSDFSKENSANKTKNNETTEQENDSKPCYEEEHRYVQRPWRTTLENDLALYLVQASNNHSKSNSFQGYLFINSSVIKLQFSILLYTCVELCRIRISRFIIFSRSQNDGKTVEKTNSDTHEGN